LIALSGKSSHAGYPLVHSHCYQPASPFR
jgi:hypothetical protein